MCGHGHPTYQVRVAILAGSAVSHARTSTFTHDLITLVLGSVLLILIAIRLLMARTTLTVLIILIAFHSHCSHWPQRLTPMAKCCLRNAAQAAGPPSRLVFNVSPTSKMNRGCVQKGLEGMQCRGSAFSQYVNAVLATICDIRACVLRLSVARAYQKPINRGFPPG